jgi:hypothetical protein
MMLQIIAFGAGALSVNYRHAKGLGNSPGAA